MTRVGPKLNDSAPLGAAGPRHRVPVLRVVLGSVVPAVWFGLAALALRAWYSGFLQGSDLTIPSRTLVGLFGLLVLVVAVETAVSLGRWFMNGRRTGDWTPPDHGYADP